MKARLKLFAVFAVSALLLLLPMSSAMASTSSNVATVALSVTVTNSITIAATPGNISFTAPSGAASGPISITANWNLSNASTNFVLDAYFLTPTAALTGPTSIPSSSVFGSVNSGTATAFTATDSSNTAATVGGTLQIFRGSIAATGTQTDSLLLSINGLSGTTPGTYTGTLNISAQAN
jgi:hypothetical protein